MNTIAKTRWKDCFFSAIGGAAICIAGISGAVISDGMNAGQSFIVIAIACAIGATVSTTVIDRASTVSPLSYLAAMASVFTVALIMSSLR